MPRIFLCKGEREFSFNSLQTGKCIQRRQASFNKANCNKFQFPSNGKVYSKPAHSFISLDIILFQFPSNGKVYSKQCGRETVGAVYRKFQFPSNGKVYSKLAPHTAFKIFGRYLFQFPSNGKVYSKEATRGDFRDEVFVSIPFKRESVFKVT